MEKSVSGLTKRDLLMIKDEFQNGITKNNFGLVPLSELTIDSKRKKGYVKPTTPLYGKGDSEEESYKNMMEIIKEGNKWILRPKASLHWSGKLTLDFLFKIHEHGATVMQERGGKVVFIRIPPRPALLLAYRRFLIKKRKDKRETVKDVKKAVTTYINTGNTKKLKIFEDWLDRDSLKTEGL
jgi:hypothetical protein